MVSAQKEEKEEAQGKVVIAVAVKGIAALALDI